MDIIKHPLTQLSIIGLKDCTIQITSNAFYNSPYEVISDARFRRNIWFDIVEEITRE